MTYHGVSWLLEYTTVDFLLGFLAMRQMMANDWFAPECTTWFLSYLKTVEVLLLKLYFQVVRVHRRSTKQLFPGVSATTCDSSRIVEAVCQELHVLHWDADPKANYL